MPSWWRLPGVKLLSDSILAVLAVISVTILAAFLEPAIGPNAVLLLYFLAILITALWLRQGPILFMSLGCALVWNFLFLKPYYTLHIDHLNDFIMFVMFSCVALVSGYLTGRLRDQTQAALRREEELAFLYEATSRMNQTFGLQAILALASLDLKKSFQADATFFLPGDPPPAGMNVLEKQALQACFTTGQAVDSRTPGFSALTRSFLPACSQGSVKGVVGIELAATSGTRESLLRAYVQQLAILLDRELLAEYARRVRTNEEIDRLYATLLNLITHELRTPMSVIKGATALLEKTTSVSADERQRLAREAQSAVDRLDRLIDNLLDMSRIESGKLRLNLDWCDIAEIINLAAEHVRVEFPQAQIEIDVENIYLLRLDFNLMEKAIYNLIRNTFVHNSERADVMVRLRAHFLPDRLRIEVVDNGKGLHTGLQSQPFARFARRTDSGEGIGIGLSVVKGLIESMGGVIEYDPTPPGARFYIEFLRQADNMRPFQVAL